jgi:hypothetical protein
MINVWTSKSFILNGEGEMRSENLSLLWNRLESANQSYILNYPCPFVINLYIESYVVEIHFFHLSVITKEMDQPSAVFCSRPWPYSSSFGVYYFVPKVKINFLLISINEFFNNIGNFCDIVLHFSINIVFP